MKIGVILVHGIGDQNESWANCLEHEINKRTFDILGNILGDKKPKDISEVLAIKNVYWQDVVRDSQEKLMDVLKAFKINAKKNIFSKLFMKYIREPVQSLKSEIVAKYVGDIIAYLTPEAKSQIQLKITNALEDIANINSNANEKMPLTIVAHSLGTVISSDYVYDKTKERGGQTFHGRLSLYNIFTVGSPMALFSMQFGGIENFKKPIHVENNHGRWINILDEDDFVAMPLTPLNDAYREAVFKDVPVNTGFWGNAHTNYFNKPETPDMITNKLALDWLDINKKMDTGEIQNLARKYDETFKII